MKIKTTTAFSATLTAILGTVTGLLNIVTDVPPLVAHYPNTTLLACVAVLVLVLATERQRLSGWVHNRPVFTSAVLAGLLIIVPPGLGHGIYGLDAQTNLQLATLCGILAIILVLLESWHSPGTRQPRADVILHRDSERPG